MHLISILVFHLPHTPTNGKSIHEACCRCGGSNYRLVAPSTVPSDQPSPTPSSRPSSEPSVLPSSSGRPSVSNYPSTVPSIYQAPSVSIEPSTSPSLTPSLSSIPFRSPSYAPSPSPSPSPPPPMGEGSRRMLRENSYTRTNASPRMSTFAKSLALLFAAVLVF
jgi:hypothetical protein